jgi:hypothetical protein
VKTFVEKCERGTFWLCILAIHQQFCCLNGQFVSSSSIRKKLVGSDCVFLVLTHIDVAQSAYQFDGFYKGEEP